MPLNRRTILKNTAAIALATGLPEWFVKRNAVLAADIKPAPTTKPKLPVALVGCGGRGQWVAGVDGKDHFDVVAICDPDDKQIKQAQEKFPDAQVYKDFRKVMERKDVKAIVNGTPDHWHTLI